MGLPSLLPPLRLLSEPLVLEQRAEYMNASAAAPRLNLDLFSTDIQRREQQRPEGQRELSTFHIEPAGQCDIATPLMCRHVPTRARANGSQKHTKTFGTGLNVSLMKDNVSDGFSVMAKVLFVLLKKSTMTSSCHHEAQVLQALFQEILRSLGKNVKRRIVRTKGFFYYYYSVISDFYFPPEAFSHWCRRYTLRIIDS